MLQPNEVHDALIKLLSLTLWINMSDILISRLDHVTWSQTIFLSRASKEKAAQRATWWVAVLLFQTGLSEASYVSYTSFTLTQIFPESSLSLAALHLLLSVTFVLGWPRRWGTGWRERWKGKKIYTTKRFIPLVLKTAEQSDIRQKLLSPCRCYEEEEVCFRICIQIPVVIQMANELFTRQWSNDACWRIF